MNEITILLIIFIIYHAWFVYQTKKERSDLLKAIMAKDLTDFTNSKAVEEAKPSNPQEEPIEAENIDQDLFQRMIESQNKK